MTESKDSDQKEQNTVIEEDTNETELKQLSEKSEDTQKFELETALDT